jgi:DNA-binding GntR family transcriptional regulator
MGGLLDQGQRILRLYALHMGDRIPTAALKSHRDMLEAIRRGDADAAEEAGRADAQALIDNFMQSLAERPTELLELRPPPKPRRKAARGEAVL